MLTPDPLVNAALILAGALGIGGLVIRRSSKSTVRIVGAAMIWETIAVLMIAWFASARSYHEPVAPWIIPVALVALFVIPGATYWRVQAELGAANNPESAKRLRSIDSGFAKFAKVALLSLPLGSCAYVVGSILGSTGEGWSPSSDAGGVSALFAVAFAWYYVSRQDSRNKMNDTRRSGRRASATE